MVLRFHEGASRGGLAYGLGAARTAMKFSSDGVGADAVALMSSSHGRYSELIKPTGSIDGEPFVDMRFPLADLGTMEPKTEISLTHLVLKTQL
jgi:hypothetical protein